MKNKITIVILAMLLSVGCAQIPTSELGQYTEAFNQTKQASELVILDFDQTLKEARQYLVDYQKTKSKTEPIKPYPDSLEKSIEIQKREAQIKDIVVRQKAFSVIDSYNDVLTKLAEGKSIQEVQSATSGLITAASKLAEVAASATVPGLSAFMGLAETIVGLFEKARLMKEFKIAVQDGSPVVTAILNSLIEDTNEHYKARYFLSNEKRLLIVDGIAARVYELRLLIKMHTVPLETIIVIEEELNAAIQEAALELGKQYPAKITERESDDAQPAAAQPAAYTALVQVNVDQIIKANQVLGNKYKENVNYMKAHNDMLVNYRNLLNKTIDAMNTLEAALSKPQNIADQADEILSIAFELRRNIEDLKKSFSSQS